MRTRDSLAVSIGMIAQQGSMFLLGIIIGRTIGATEFGIYNLLRNFLTWLLTAAPLGLDLALIRISAETEDKSAVRDLIWKTRIVIFAFASATAVAAFVVLSYYFSQTADLSGFDRIYILATLLALPAMADILIAGAQFRYNRLYIPLSASTDMLQSVVRLLCGGAIAMVYPDLLAFIMVNLMASIASLLALNALSRRYALRPIHQSSLSWRKYLARLPGFLSSSIWIALSMLAYGLLRIADLAVLALFVPGPELGAYAAIASVAILVQIYPGALSQGLAPTVADHHARGDSAGIVRELSANIRRSSVVASFAFGGIAAFGPHLDLLFGPTFQFDPLICFTLPLSWLLSACLNPTGLALSLTGRHRQETVLITLGAALLLVLLLLAAPPFGTTGAALSLLGSLAFMQSGRVILVRRVLGQWVGSWRDLLPMVLALVAAYASEWAIFQAFPKAILTLISACLLYSAVYGLVTAAIVLSSRERTDLVAVLSRVGRPS